MCDGIYQCYRLYWIGEGGWEQFICDYTSLIEHEFCRIGGKFERKMIRMALTQNQFKIVRTANQLKLTRHALRYRMQKLGLNTIRNGEDSGEENNGRRANPTKV